MNFGKWKEQVYMTIAHASSSKNEECLRWIQQVESASGIADLIEVEPFGHADRQLAKQLHNNMHGVTLQYYLSLSKTYTAEGRIMKGRQMLWLIFQNYQVDKGSIELYKSQQLRQLKLGNN